MALKVTIFGPVHAGKSTLAGYLRWLGSNAESEKEISRARVDLGSAFDESQALAYLVDLSKDERIRDPASGQTTSKRLHVTSVRLRTANEFDIIDTPGGWRKHRDQRLRGLYYGDVGIFAIEPITDAFSAVRLGETAQARAEAFSALLTWVALRPAAPLIVAVTKTDLASNDRVAFDRTRAFVDEVLGARVKPIYLPISINVRERADWNVIEPSGPIKDWAPGESLVKVLSQIDVSTPPRLDEPVMLVTRRAAREGRGPVYMGKVIAGSFQRGDRVRMAPVALPHGGGYAALTARAAFLERSAEHVDVDQLVAGDIGGIGLGSGSLRQVIEQESTLITHESVPLAQGRYLTLVLPSSERPTWLRIQAHVEVVWLGRYYQCKVYECENIAEGFRVGTLVQLPAGLAIPLKVSDGTLVLNDVLVSSAADEVQFVKARITALGHVVGLRIPGNADRDHLFAKAPTARSIMVGDVIEGDESMMDRITALLVDHLIGNRLTAPYSVMTKTSAVGD